MPRVRGMFAETFRDRKSRSVRFVTCRESGADVGVHGRHDPLDSATFPAAPVSNLKLFGPVKLWSDARMNQEGGGLGF